MSMVKNHNHSCLYILKNRKHTLLSNFKGTEKDSISTVTSPTWEADALILILSKVERSSISCSRPTPPLGLSASGENTHETVGVSQFLTFLISQT